MVTTRPQTASQLPIDLGHPRILVALYMFVVVNFDALAQASGDFRIERRQVVFFC